MPQKKIIKVKQHVEGYLGEKGRQVTTACGASRQPLWKKLVTKDKKTRDAESALVKVKEKKQEVLQRLATYKKQKTKSGVKFSQRPTHDNSKSYKSFKSRSVSIMSMNLRQTSQKEENSPTTPSRFMDNKQSQIDKIMNKC